jgi:hypothetical protein
VKSYASSKFIGGRGRFNLNAANCSLNSPAFVIIVGDMFDMYEGMSRVVLSWHAYRYFHALIVAISIWISFVPSHPEVILVVAQWSSTSHQALMFFLGLSVLSYRFLNVLSFLES